MLSKVELSKNAFTRLPNVLKKLQSINSLDVSYNQLKRLPNWLKQLVQLRELTLYYNPIPRQDCIRWEQQLPKCQVKWETEVVPLGK